MSLTSGSSDRSVIPRWRISSAFEESEESRAVVEKKAVVFSGDQWFDRTMAEWRESPTAGLLADLYSTAVLEGRSEQIPFLAKEVIGLGDKIPRALQKMAKAALGLDSAARSSVGPDLDDSSVVWAQISALKARLRNSPENGFIWNDLAYAYNLIGERVKSERAMLAALKVSSSHRLIARGASRLFVHHEDPARALDVLRRADGFSRDPWLLSAHLAIAQMADLGVSHINAAKQIFERIGTGNPSSSELGMALATQELRSGKKKRAKLIAKESSVSATENALAQGVWLSNRLGTDIVARNTTESAKDAFEARYWQSYYAGEWSRSLLSVRQWLRDEPFSVIPALQGSFVAATFCDDYSMSWLIAEFGLKHNPESWALRNNLVVALALDGLHDRAILEFKKLVEPVRSSRDFPVWSATSGLLHYRDGQLDAARGLYGQAKSAFESINDRTGQLLLTLYQSMEEARMGNDEVATELIRGVHKKLGFKSGGSSILDTLALEVRSEKPV